MKHKQDSGNHNKNSQFVMNVNAKVIKKTENSTKLTDTDIGHHNKDSQFAMNVNTLPRIGIVRGEHCEIPRRNALAASGPDWFQSIKMCSPRIESL
jgi:hypothetical protein